MPRDRVGPYQIVRELGRGGMGVVYEARHPELSRSVALKVVLPGEGSLARFEREARLLAKVQHPGVVKIHAVGRLEDGAGAYLVTELLVGEDLHRARIGGLISPRRAAEIVRDVADAVACIHEQGVLHRDLKPANVMLLEDGRPVLLDFGLARDDLSEKLTKTGALVGTPAFMAPEQADAAHASVDARTDVYGLGAVLYFLLAGRAPFEGAPAQVVVRVLSEEPPSPSADDPAVPPELSAICRRAMSKEREERYAGARALRDDLDRWLSGLAPTGGRARRRPLALVAALAGAGLALGASAVVLSAPAKAPPPPIAPAPPPPPPPAAAPAKPRGTTRVSDYLRHVARVAAARREGKLTAELANGLSKYARGPLAWVPYPSSPVEDQERFESAVRFLDATRIVVRTHRNRELRVYDLEAAPIAPHALATFEGYDGSTRYYAMAVGGAPRARTIFFAGKERVERVVVDLERPLPERLVPEVVVRVPEERTATPDATHPDVIAIAAREDGRLLGVGGHWTSAWVFDLSRPGARPLELPGHAGDVRDIAFSPDGRRIATACRNGTAIDAAAGTVETAKLWSSDGKQELALGHLFRIDAVVFRPGTDEIGLAGAGATLTLARPGAEKPRMIVTERAAQDLAGCQFTHLAFSPDGARAFSLARLEGRGYAWTIWDLKTGRYRTTELATINPASASSLALSPDGSLIALATSDERGIAIYPTYETGDEVP